MQTSTLNAAAVREITVAHSPDADDAFMFYGLATNKIRTPGLKFSHTLTDIESLNRAAMAGSGKYDVSAISFHAYPYVQEKYALMSCGGSVGEGYGPIIVSQQPMTPDDAKRTAIAVPGTLTTAYLALKLWGPKVKTEVVAFDQIIPRILDGDYEAGLIIHEGQLSYSRKGLHKVLDLGRWWQDRTGLPLPLGGNAIKRDLGSEVSADVTQALRESIRYALENRDEALEYAMQFARDVDKPTANNFVGMYVNDRTLDYGANGKEAIRRLLEMGYQAGIIKIAAHVDFV